MKSVFLCMISAILAMAAVAGGQEPVQSKGLRIVEVHPVATPTPFPLDAQVQPPAGASLAFLAPEQMSTADQGLVAANRAEIARRAALQGFALEAGSREPERGGWGYEQAVCPVFPGHLVLEYSRDAGMGDVSLFSVVIPRGEGHVRVIPVRRRSYSLFTPAGSNALTLNDFNHMVEEEGSGVNPDWLTLGLCYAALAGGHVRAALIPGSPEDEHYPLFAPARLTVSNKGGAEVSFTDVTPHEKALDWELTFAQSGRLMKVRRSLAPELIERPVKASPGDSGKPGN